MRKRSISLNELRRRLKALQLVRVRTKMSVKITKASTEPDFIIEKFELPSNYRFHTFTFNLGIPNRAKIAIEVYESKGHRLINRAVFRPQNAAPFYASLLFYTDVRHVDFNFKLVNPKVNDVYYLYKSQMENDVKLDLDFFESRFSKSNQAENPFFKNNKQQNFPKKANKGAKNLEELKNSSIFEVIKLFNFEIKGEFSKVLQEIETLTRDYFSLLKPTLVPAFESQLETFEKPQYNLILYIVNNYRYKVKNTLEIGTNGTEGYDEFQEVYKIHTENKSKLEEMLETSKILKTEKTSINANITEIQETVRDYKVKYSEIVEDLRVILNRQSNLSGKMEAIKRSEYEAEKLEELKDTLLRELCRIRRIKELLGRGDDTENDFQNKFTQVVEVLYRELGKDVLEIDTKIQDYMEILAYCQGDLEENELEIEANNLTESGQEILKEVESLKIEWKKLQDRLLEVNEVRRKLLTSFLELKIKNILISELIMYIEKFQFARQNTE